MLGKRLKDLFQRFWPISVGEEVDPSRLGQILIRMGAIDERTLKEALTIKTAKPHKLLGQILIEHRWCSQESVNRAIEKQQEETRLGQVLVKSELISAQQLEESLLEQEKTGRLLGFILVEKGYCTAEELKESLRQQRHDNRIGALLLREKKITERQLEKALSLQKDTQVLLGEILINQGYVSAEELKDILDKQLVIMRQLPESAKL